MALGGFFRDVGWSAKVEDISPGQTMPEEQKSAHRLSFATSCPSELPRPVTFCLPGIQETLRHRWRYVVILSATPAARTAETESPPPTIDNGSWIIRDRAAQP